MFVYDNPHPKGLRTRDCVKRACVIASQINYHDINIMLNRYKNITGAKKFNTNDNWREFIVNVLLGVDVGNMQFANHGHRYTAKEYAEKCDVRAIMQVAGHLVSCNGKGDYLDTWDSGYKSIYKVYKLPQYDIIVEHIKRNYPKLCKGLGLEKRKVRIIL